MYIYFDPNTERYTKEDLENWLFARVTYDSQADFFKVALEDKGDNFLADMVYLYDNDTAEFDWYDFTQGQISCEAAADAMRLSVEYLDKELIDWYGLSEEESEGCW